MNKATLKLIYQYSDKKLVPSLLLTLFLIVCAAISSVALPIILKTLVDHLSNQNINSTFLILFIFYALIMLAERFFNEAQFISYSTWENGIIQNAYKKTFQSLFYKKSEFFTETLHGTITSNIFQAIFGLDGLMFDFIFKILPVFISFALTIVSITIIFDFQMSLIIILGTLTYIYCMFIFNGKILCQQNKIRNCYSTTQGATTDLINSWKDIKTTRSHDFATNILNSKIRDLTKKTKIFYRKRSIFGFVQSLPICFIFIFSNAYTILKYTNGASTIGGILLINNYLFQMLRPLESFSLVFRSFIKNYSDFSMLEEIVAPDDKSPSEMKNKQHISEIRLNNVGVEKILNGINLKLEAGDKIAIIGTSGSGKSTLLNTLAGLVENYSGEIYINGKEITSSGLEVLRNNISYLPSDARLFKGSIKNNVLLGKNCNFSDPLDSSFIREKILSLKNGVDTIVDEGTPTLSSGEKQRLKIARTFLLNNLIEIYDESTSALDNELEENVLDNILADKNKIIIFATHKLHYLYKFDKIYILQKGTLEKLDYDHNSTSIAL